MNLPPQGPPHEPEESVFSPETVRAQQPAKPDIYPNKFEPLFDVQKDEETPIFHELEGYFFARRAFGFPTNYEDEYYGEKPELLDLDGIIEALYAQRKPEDQTILGVPYTLKDAEDLERQLAEIDAAERAARRDAATIIIGEAAVGALAEPKGASRKDLIAPDSLVNAVARQLMASRAEPQKRGPTTIADVLGAKEMSQWQAELEAREAENRTRSQARRS